MLRKAVLLASVTALLSLGACDIIDKATGNTGEPITEADLTGRHLLFTNPNPNTDIGEHAQWEYTFNSGTAKGCNELHSYESTGWTLSGENTIRIYFGDQYEEYSLKSLDGTLPEGNLSGDFHLTSSVPGNVVDGSFRQVQSSVYCN